MSEKVTAQCGLDQVRAMLVAGLQPPLNEKLGIALIEAEHGYALFEAIPDSTAYNPMGSVHGGFIAAALDSACGIAVHTALEAGYAYTTLELKVSYLRPLTDRSGTVRSRGRLVSIGRRAAFAEASLHDGDGKLCATATSTLLVFETRR
ncbi:PaaI family thioesterase [Novosphingobium sp. YJ-S2-02]|uniref:PaaI family thioesterase n=1 Tax=Novosphingobium aureum TaxID=2792964 RepID=A0A931HFI1_9SPHN|nr:PaaI family thioesterase [Novosphingobium aureum]MBH0115175.1 PaaI family thioesterase [Novosphingobium aureum]